MAERFYQLKPRPLRPVPTPVAPTAAAAPVVVRAFAGGLGQGKHPAPAPLSSGLEVEPVAATGHRYPATATQALGPKERQKLGVLASQAWRAAAESDPGLLARYQSGGLSATAAQSKWRHEQCALATAGHPAGTVTGISEASRAHYKDLEARFLMLAGDSARAFGAAMVTGDSGITLRSDDRQAHHALKQLTEEMGKAGLHINYLKKVIAGKFGAKRDLNAKQIWQLVYTIRNRAAAKEGGNITPIRGLHANRNKSQRRGGGLQPPSAPNEPSEPNPS